MKKLLNYTVLATAVAIGSAGCGGSGSSNSNSTPTTTSTASVKYGGHVLSSAQRPTGDMTLAQIESIPVGTVLAVALDRNNSASGYYTATVMGYDALDQLLWLRLTSDVKTPSGEGDSGTPVFSLPTTFTAKSGYSALNGLLIGALSYGSADNETDFLATPISLMRSTVKASVKTTGRPASILFKGHAFKSRSTPLFSTGLPQIVLNHLKSRAGATSWIKDIVSAPVVTPALARPATATVDSTTPFGNNTVMTFAVRGDVVFEGATGSVTAADGSGWLGYGHPFNGGGLTEMATCSGTVVNMFPEPVYGTYKLADPTGVFDKTLAFDGINAVRFVTRPAKEVTLTTDLVSGTSTKSFKHFVGYDGVAGDESLFLTSAIEASYLTMYDVETDLQGYGTFTITTVIKGVTKKTVISVPASADGIFFGFDPAGDDSLDDQLFLLMYGLEESGDRTATVHVSATIKSP